MNSTKFFFEHPATVFWQDKGARQAGRPASGQPASPRIHTVAPTNTRLDKITARVKPEVALTLKHIADENRVSVSQAAAAYIERGVQGNIDMQYHALIIPAITAAFRAEFSKFANRYLAINARIAYQVGQILILLIKYMGIRLHDDVTLHRMMMESETAARVSVTRRTPQIDEVKERLRLSVEEEV